MTKKTLEKYKDTQGFLFDEATHAYFLDGKPMTGCTTILGVLAKPALIPWAARMAVEYAKDKFEILIKEGKFTYDVSTVEEILNEAKTAYAKKRDEGAQKGTDTHALVEEYIKHCIAENDGQPQLTGAEPHPIRVFQEWAIKENIRFIASEAKLYSKELFIAGTADFIFEKDGKRYIGDVKTYKKIWDRTPFYQCAGYALMWEEMNNGWNTESTTDPKIDGYVIFNLPKERSFNESEDVLWSFDIEGDTRAFKACAEIYRQNANFTR